MSILIGLLKFKWKLFDSKSDSKSISILIERLLQIFETYFSYWFLDNLTRKEKRKKTDRHD